MIKNIRGCIPWATALITIIFTLAPESLFEKIFDWNALAAKCVELEFYSGELSIVLNRAVVCVFAYIVAYLLRGVYLLLRRRVTIKGENYTIRVEYGNLIKKKEKCNKIISFDECFTTTIGKRPQDVKSESICGQYLLANPQINVQQLIVDARITPEMVGSDFQNQTRYKSGTLIQNGDDLLLAFVPLNANGNGEFHTYQEYLDSLNLLWEEIDKYYSQKNVCVPILGSSGFSRMPDVTLDQQKLLDVMIESYKLSPHKIDTILHIVCRKKDGFSLNKIGESL